MRTPPVWHDDSSPFRAKDLELRKQLEPRPLSNLPADRAVLMTPPKHGKRYLEMVALFEKGWTHSMIAEKYGISRERVGQVLGRADKIKRESRIGERDILTVGEARKLIGAGESTFSIFLSRHPELKVDREHVAKVKLLVAVDAVLSKPCRMCGKPINRFHLNAKYCEQHKRRNTAFRNWPKDMKSAHRQHVKNWVAKNLDKKALIQKRVNLRVRLTKAGLSRAEAYRQAKAAVPYPWKGEA